MTSLSVASVISWFNTLWFQFCPIEHQFDIRPNQKFEDAVKGNQRLFKAPDATCEKGIVYFYFFQPWNRIQFIIRFDVLKWS